MIVTTIRGHALNFTQNTRPDPTLPHIATYAMRCRIFTGLKALEVVVINQVVGIVALIGCEILLCLSTTNGEMLH
jgi:enoyl-CoA hydratase/carnithine racemase